jgi:hypothetical protein
LATAGLASGSETGDVTDISIDLNNIGMIDVLASRAKGPIGGRLAGERPAF